MRGLMLTRWRSDPELVELPDPEPGPGEVLLRVGGCGCCHTDVTVCRDAWPGTVAWQPPFVLGHEIAGWALALGPGVEGIELNAGYVAYAAVGCGECSACRVGLENYCERQVTTPPALGLGRNGGMADYVVVPARHLVPLGDFEPAAAAPLADAGLTTYHAVKRVRGSLGPGSHALVIGLGGLGTTAVQVLKAMTDAVVIGVDSQIEPLAVARAAGADHVLRFSPTTREQIRELTGGRGCEAVLDLVGETATMRLGLTAGRPGGSLTVIGMTHESYPWSFAEAPPEMTISSTLWGSVPELHEVVSLTQQGLIRPTIERYTLDGAVDAFKRLEHGELCARAVIVP